MIGDLIQIHHDLCKAMLDTSGYVTYGRCPRILYNPFVHIYLIKLLHINFNDDANQKHAFLRLSVWMESLNTSKDGSNTVDCVGNSFAGRTSVARCFSGSDMAQTSRNACSEFLALSLALVSMLLVPC